MFDPGAMMVRDMIKEMIAQHGMADAGTGMDTGQGLGVADLWVTIGDVEYLVSVRRANHPGG